MGKPLMISSFLVTLLCCITFNVVDASYHDLAAARPVSDKQTPEYNSQQKQHKQNDYDDDDDYSDGYDGYEKYDDYEYEKPSYNDPKKRKFHPPTVIKAGFDPYQFVAEVEIGNPPQKVKVKFDSTKTNSWFEYEEARRKKSSYHYYYEKNGEYYFDDGYTTSIKEKNGFDPSWSETFTNLDQPFYSTDVTSNNGHIKRVMGNLAEDYVCVGNLTAETKFGLVKNYNNRHRDYYGVLGFGINEDVKNTKLDSWFQRVYATSHECSQPIYGFYPPIDTIVDGKPVKREAEVTLCGYYRGPNDPEPVSLPLSKKGKANGVWQISLAKLLCGDQDLLLEPPKKKKPAYGYGNDDSYDYKDDGYNEYEQDDDYDDEYEQDGDYDDEYEQDDDGYSEEEEYGQNDYNNDGTKYYKRSLAAHGGDSSEEKCTTNGQMKCSGTGFLTCDHGTFVYRDCGPQTACKDSGKNQVVCDFGEKQDHKQQGDKYKPEYKKQEPSYGYYKPKPKVVYEALLDTTAKEIKVPPKVFKRLIKKVGAKCNGDECMVDCNAKKELPTFKFVFDAKDSFELTPDTYVLDPVKEEESYDQDSDYKQSYVDQESYDDDYKPETQTVPSIYDKPAPKHHVQNNRYGQKQEPVETYKKKQTTYYYKKPVIKYCYIGFKKTDKSKDVLTMGNVFFRENAPLFAVPEPMKPKKKVYKKKPSYGGDYEGEEDYDDDDEEEEEEGRRLYKRFGLPREARVSFVSGGSSSLPARTGGQFGGSRSGSSGSSRSSASTTGGFLFKK